LRKYRNLVAIISILSLFPGLCLASQKTILFKIRNDSPPSIASNFAGNKKLGHQIIVENLRSSSTESQSDFVGALNVAEAGKIASFERFWIANIVKVTGDSAVLEALTARPDVESISEDYPVELITPVEEHETTKLSNGPDSSLIAIKAPDAWKIGLDGTGSLVCNFDTGVNGAHSALSSKYRGNNGGSSDACWFDPYTHTQNPSDNNGHGTHTMGTMVGSEVSDTVGVAPGAQWIAAAVVDRGAGIQRTISDILAAFQWAADPDGNPATTDDVPDVVNNSWGIPLGYYPPCEATFWEAIDNLEAAGVVCIFAAGNEGSNPSTMRIPADRITSNFNSFSVGAVDANNPDLHVADFSSRGPSACDHTSIKPEVTAPGVAIRSTSRSGDYAIMSGTSMAAPHVAGAVAILRQFNPEATPSEIKQALINSALDLGTPGEDNDYGWGLINIRRAIDYMPTPENPFLTIVSESFSNPDAIVPGATLDLNISIDNLGAVASNATAHLTCANPEIQILSGDISFGSLAHNDTSAVLGWTFHFSDELNSGDTVIFDIELSADGWTAHRNIIIVLGDQTTGAADFPVLPHTLSIKANYPNPFNSSTIIQLEGQPGQNSLIMIFDTTGRLVKKLIATSNNPVWDGTDSDGNTVSAGIYFARLSGVNSSAIKMLLLK
jgi:subtilisin family serine protease